MIIKPKRSVNGTISVPGDKSISHRSIMFGSLADGKTTISHFLMGDDCISTINCFRALGIDITVNDDEVTVYGKGIYGLSKPDQILDCGNSGTTTRLLCGILAAQNFDSTLTGDASIQRRPMKRVIEPLAKMGAVIKAKDDNYCPLEISPSRLKGITYHSPISSAQLKSALLFAGLYADSPTTVIEPEVSRDHTERMLSAFGGTVIQDGKSVTVMPCPQLKGQHIEVPGDISSAAYFIVAALILEGSSLTIKNVGINPTRAGIIDVLTQMGGRIELTNKRIVCGEPVCDITVEHSRLHGVTVSGSIIPTLIDEIPILAVAAAFASGTTIIKNAEELKVKESNRIDALYNELTKMGANITKLDDGLIIEGGAALCGAEVDSYDDHRIAMSLAIAALKCSSETFITNPSCIKISFPNFFEILEAL
jgi:3-phosphoshikimate 1-carboxyvinyltransferase